MGVEYYIFALFVAALVCGVAIVFKLLFSNVKKEKEELDKREAEVYKTYSAAETLLEEFEDQAKTTLDELKKRELEYRELIQNNPVIETVAEPVQSAPVAEKPQRPLSPEEKRIKAAGDVIERAERYIVHDSTPDTRLKPPPVIQAFTSAETTITPIPVVSPKAAQAAYASLPAQKAVQSVKTTQEEKAKATTVVFQKFFDDAAEAPPPAQYAPDANNGASKKDIILELTREGKTDVEIASQLGITRNEVQLVIGMAR